MAVFSAAIPLLLLFLSVSSPSVNGNVAPSGGDCASIVITNMGKCLPFVMIGSQVEKPDGHCCPGLKKVLHTKAECLCEVLKESVSMGLKINITKVDTLPAICKHKLHSMTLPDCLSSAKSPASAPVPAKSPAKSPAKPPAKSPAKSPASAPAPVPAARPLPGSGSGSPSASAPAPSSDSFIIL